jgi:hypothetical protein
MRCAHFPSFCNGVTGLSGDEIYIAQGIETKKKVWRDDAGVPLEWPRQLGPHR